MPRSASSAVMLKYECNYCATIDGRIKLVARNRWRSCPALSGWQRPGWKRPLSTLGSKETAIRFAAISSSAASGKIGTSREAAIVEEPRHMRIASAMFPESMHQHCAVACGGARAERPIGNEHRRAAGGRQRELARVRHGHCFSLRIFSRRTRSRVGGSIAVSPMQIRRFR